MRESVKSSTVPWLLALGACLTLLRPGAPTLHALAAAAQSSETITATIPATVSLPPGGAVQFSRAGSSPPMGAPPLLPPAMLLVLSYADEPATATEDASATLTVSAGPGSVALVDAPVAASCTVDPTDDATTICAPVDVGRPPLGSTASFTTLTQTQVVQASYMAGWNLAGVPSGSLLNVPGVVAAYQEDPQSQSFVPVDLNQPAVAGLSYWIYAQRDTTVPCSVVGGGTEQVDVPTTAYVPVSNPFPTAARLTGDVVAFTYDPTTAQYVPAPLLGTVFGTPEYELPVGAAAMVRAKRWPATVSVEPQVGCPPPP